MKTVVVWNMMPRGVVEMYLRFKGICQLQNQG